MGEIESWRRERNNFLSQTGGENASFKVFIDLYTNGTDDTPIFDFPVVVQTWRHDDESERLGRPFGPAVLVHCKETGVLVYEGHYLFGKPSNPNGGARVLYDRDTGEIDKREFFVSGQRFFPHDPDNVKYEDYAQDHKPGDIVLGV